VETARRNGSLYVAPLIDAICSRGYQPETVAMDKGYDNNRVMDETLVCLREGCPIPLTAIPYGSAEWKRLYRGRAAVEREFGRLKNEYGLTPLRTRGSPVYGSTPTSWWSPISGRRSGERGLFRSRRNVFARQAPDKKKNVVLALSTVAIVAIAVVVIVALLALVYIIPRGGRRRS
jgi:hypothetical protein